MKAGRLAIVNIDGKNYYQDERMQEYRNVNDFSDSLRFIDVHPSKIRLVEPRIEYGTKAWKEFTSKSKKMKRKL